MRLRGVSLDSLFNSLNFLTRPRCVRYRRANSSRPPSFRFESFLLQDPGKFSKGIRVTAPGGTTRAVPSHKNNSNATGLHTNTDREGNTHLAEARWVLRVHTWQDSAQRRDSCQRHPEEPVAPAEARAFPRPCSRGLEKSGVSSAGRREGPARAKGALEGSRKGGVWQGSTGS